MVDQENIESSSINSQSSNSGLKNMESLSIIRVPWKILSIVGVLLGIIASCIAIITYLKVDRLEDLAVKAQNWEIDIRLEEPLGGLANAVRIKGEIDFRTAAAENKTTSKVNLSLYQNKIALMCLVRPILKEKCIWHQQVSPVVYADGAFDGLVFLGSEDGKGTVSIAYQIVLLAVPKSPDLKTRIFQELPFYFVASRIVSVKGRYK